MHDRKCAAPVWTELGMIAWAGRALALCCLAAVVGCDATDSSSRVVDDLDNGSVQTRTTDFDLWLSGVRIGQAISAVDASGETWMATWLPPGSDSPVERTHTLEVRDGRVVQLQSLDQGGTTIRGRLEDDTWRVTRAGTVIQTVAVRGALASPRALVERCYDQLPCTGFVVDPTSGIAHAAATRRCPPSTPDPGTGGACVELQAQTTSWWWVDEDGQPLVVGAAQSATWARAALREQLHWPNAVDASIHGSAFDGIEYAPRAWFEVSGLQRVEALDGGRQTLVSRNPDVVRVVQEARLGSLTLPFEAEAPDARPVAPQTDAEALRQLAPLRAESTTVRELVRGVAAHIRQTVAPVRVALPSDPSRALRDAVGDCTERADIAVLLLTHAGVPARTVHGVA